MALSCAPTFLPLEDRRHGWGDGDPIRIRELGPRSLRLGPSWARGALAFGPSVGDPIRIRELGTHLLLGLPGLGGERFLFVAEKETEDVVENSLFSFVHRLSATDNLFLRKTKNWSGGGRARTSTFYTNLSMAEQRESWSSRSHQKGRPGAERGNIHFYKRNNGG